MSHPRELLERKCLSEYYKTMDGYGRLKESIKLILHLIFFVPNILKI